MTDALVPKPDRRSNTDSNGAAWKWGIGAAGIVAFGVAAFNLVRAQRVEEEHPPIGRFIEVEGTRLHYIEQGTGPLIVLLHGNGATFHDWLASGIFDALAQTNRVIAFDRPGFGYSKRPRNVIWTPAAQARVIAAALSAIGGDHATIVGHSFGTLVAVQLGLDHPEVAGSLVLISGYYYPSVRLDAVFGSAPAVPLVGDAIRYTISPILGAALKPGMEKQLFAPAPVSEGWKNEYPFEMTLRPSQIRASAAEAAIMVPAAASTAPRLNELTLPVVIIAGDGDKVVTTSAQSVRLAEELPQSQLIVIQEAGHMVHHTAKVQVASAIKEAAEQIPAAAQTPSFVEPSTL